MSDLKNLYYFLFTHIILGKHIKLKQLSGGSINYNKAIKRQAKISLNNILDKNYETNDAELKDMWAPFVEALENTKLLPDGAVKRGLMAYSDGSKLHSTDLIDLAAGKIKQINV